MEENNILTNEEAMEATEQIAARDPKKWLRMVGAAGLGVLGGVLIYKFIVKPAAAKRKAKKESEKEEYESPAFIVDDADET